MGLQKIEPHWDDMLRLAGSLKLGCCRISERRRAGQVNCGARTQDESTCSTSKGCAFRST
ncbi:MAG TPA: hypothetical protein DCW29_17835 [Janthinobacterium sp.]|nr:hypothetical protein [Janthinobacterium sp.]